MTEPRDRSRGAFMRSCGSRLLWTRFAIASVVIPDVGHPTADRVRFARTREVCAMERAASRAAQWTLEDPGRGRDDGREDVPSSAAFCRRRARSAIALPTSAAACKTASASSTG
eukprot:16441911-Heterocapsa_arctica.AAC.1